jgi:hypothetical protein
MRSMVEREARTTGGWIARVPGPNRGASLSTALRAVPLPQVGEERPAGATVAVKTSGPVRREA